jgi:hypothetical protein
MKYEFPTPSPDKKTLEVFGHEACILCELLARPFTLFCGVRKVRVSPCALHTEVELGGGSKTLRPPQRQHCTIAGGTHVLILYAVPDADAGELAEPYEFLGWADGKVGWMSWRGTERSSLEEVAARGSKN